jgi:hypothetical protein
MAQLVVNTGKAITTNRIKGSGTEPNWTAWGTGAGTAGATDTTLFTEDSGGSPAYARIAGTSTQQTTTTTNDTYRVVGEITSNGTKTITNAGLFDAVTTGNLFAKADFTGIPLLVNDSIQFTFNIQLT